MASSVLWVVRDHAGQSLIAGVRKCEADGTLGWHESPRRPRPRQRSFAPAGGNGSGRAVGLALPDAAIV